MKLRLLALTLTLLQACTPGVPKADAAPPQAAPIAAVQAKPANQLGTMAGQAITLDDLDAAQRGSLVRQKAKAELERWKVLRGLAQQAASKKALEIGAKQSGVSPEAFLAKMQKDVPLNPVTPEIIQAVYMGNQAHFQGQTLDQVKGMIAEQLGREFAAAQKHEISDRLLARFPFKATLTRPDLPRMQVDAPEAPSMGGKQAPVTVVIFSDFECPYCGRQATINERLANHYGDSVRWVYRHYPLDFHHHATKLAIASVCAQDQDKFWPFHDRLFAERTGFDQPGLLAHAKATGVADLQAFERCLNDPAKGKVINRDMAAADAAFIEGTPALFINGQPLYSMVDASDLQALINAELTSKGVQAPPPIKQQH